MTSNQPSSLDRQRAETTASPNETRSLRGRALRRVSLALIFSALALLVVALLAGNVTAGLWTRIAAALFLSAGVAGLVARRVQRVALGRWLLSLLFLAGYLAVVLPAALGLGDGVSRLWAPVWLGALVLTAGLLLGRRWGTAAALLGLAGLLPALLLGTSGATALTAGAGLLVFIAVVMFAFLLNLTFETVAETRAIARDVRRSLQQMRATLDGQVEERTRTLALAARVGRQITRIQTLDSLLHDSVELIRDRFDLYYVQVYLLNPVTRQLVLHAGTGETGAELLRRGHRLAAEPGSINGTAATSQQPVVVPHARHSPVFLPNPLLPETQSEMAIPMIIDNEVIGVLNLQSSEAEGLSADNLTVFSLLAAQLATAVENARLFNEIAETREQLVRQTEQLTQDSWRRFLPSIQEGTGSLTGLSLEEPPEAQALSAAEPVNYLRQPIDVRGTTIGYMELGTPTTPTPLAQELTAAVAGQLGAHLENLRLTRQAEAALHEARRRERELALVNQVVTKIAATSDLSASLQLIVDQLAMATSIGQVGVAILNESRTALTVVSDRSGQLNTQSAVGFVIPLENNPASQKAIAERRPVVVADATSSPLTASAHEVLRQRGVKTILILPLVVENEVIGTVGLDVVEEGIELTEEQLRLAETIVYQGASAIQRARLFEETESARRDAERLYRLSAALNAALSADQIIEAIVTSELAEGASSVSIADIETRADGQPEWSTLVALWPGTARAEAGDNRRPIVPGVRFRLAETGVAAYWLAQPNEPLTIEDAATDERVDGLLRELRGTQDVRSIVALPLKVREQWVGLVSLTWQTRRAFDAHDRRIYRSMAAQLAVALSNQQLLAQVRARSRQLENLSRIEADLSLATTEDEMLAALAAGLLPGWESGSARGPVLDLTYLLTRASDGALLAESVSHWEEGRVGRHAEADTALLRTIPLSTLWLDRPREMLVIEDVAHDSRLNESMRDQAHREDWRSLALLPLQRGGQWQGLVSIAWPEPHTLSADETFLMQRLHEPLAATVAGRRAYLAQRAALAQTEALYNVSARLNMAQSYDDILAVISQHTEMGHAADALLFVHFDQPWLPDRPPQQVAILAQRGRDAASAVPRANQRRRFEELPILRHLRADRPTVFADIANDPRLDRTTRVSLAAGNAAGFSETASRPRSAVFAPLVVGGQWIGYIALYYQRQAHTFAEEEIESLAGLISQVAVAAQTILLLEQTRQILASERRQRRIADTLLTSARVMSESLDEAALRDTLLQQIGETVPDTLSVRLYEWLPAENSFRLDRHNTLESELRTALPLIEAGALFSPEERPDLRGALDGRTPTVQTVATGGEFYRLPWFVGRQPAGVIELYRASAANEERADGDGGERPAPLTADDQRRCEGIIRQAALAFQNAQSYGQTQRALGDQARLTAELRTVSDVAVAASSTGVASATYDTDQLLAAAADLTRQSFDLYHAHIYLLDETESTLVLRAGAGEVGRHMVSEAWSIPVAANSIVARAAREREVVVVSDTRLSSDFLAHPLLPETLSEMAVPMIVGDHLIGILDVQADRVDRFQADDVLVHKILAAQLAVATQNAYYFAAQLQTAEKLREVDRLKTDFLAHMSHELRTPLNSIIGFAEVLLIGLDGELTERMIEDLQLIRSSGYHLRDIIGDILEMSKIEAGRLELVYESFDVRRVTSELMATAAPQAEQKGLSLNLEIAPEVGPLLADRTRIQQVLWNIVGNAIKFTERGGVSVSIDQANGDILFTVADTGIGIDPEQLPRIFDHFHQVDAGWRGSTSGTGLGLSICKSLIELHGGRIWAESEPGQGSTFRFTIPAQPEPVPEANAAQVGL